MMELFKQTTGIYRVDTEYIKLDSSITRGHDNRLKNERAYEIVRQNFQTLRVTNTWNKLTDVTTMYKPTCLFSSLPERPVQSTTPVPLEF